MKEDTTQKIPVPAARKWAEIRQRFLPLVVFLLTGIAVWQLWSERINQVVMTGQVQGDQIEITASEAGYLANLSVQDFERVQAGQKIGEVVTTDPKVLESQLAVINAEIDLIRHSLDPIAGLQRNQLNLYDLQMDLMENQITLASNRIQKSQLIRDLERSEDLYEMDAIAGEEVEQIRTELERTRSNITRAEDLVASMENRLSSYNMPDYGTGSPETRDAINSAIRVQQEQLELIKAELSPKPITAPFDGTISRVHRTNGAHLQNDQPVATLVSGDPEYILGFIPHPSDRIPEVGQEVQIISQGRRDNLGTAVIADIGSQYEEIDEVIQSSPAHTAPLGLPVKVNVSSDMDLTPGELVDISF